MREGFEDITFTDAKEADKRLASLLVEAPADSAKHVAQALRESAAPDKALVRLERFLDSGARSRTDLELMAASPRYAQLVITLLGESHYLTDIACRNPEFLAWLWQEGELERARTCEEITGLLWTQVSAFDAFESRCQSMRRFNRREILRIAARDIFAYVPLASLTEDLSNLADAMLEVAYRSAFEVLEARFGRPTMSRADGAGTVDATFTVLALGKLGGRELNFSSDIDLLFLYSDEGQTTGGTSPQLTNAEFFQKLGEMIIHALSEQTSEGHIFRVDMRLRPHGRMGPLAVSLDSALKYYEGVGQAWERQALIKTRPAAGDLRLGGQFVELTRPFVFPRYFDDETLEDIRAVKELMEAQTTARGERDTEVKLGRGGIRDIEFTVQILQLLNGGRVEALRTTHTLEAIDALGRHALLRPLEATELASNYAFLRQVEHRLQIEGGQQRHALPKEPEALDELARRLGYQSGTAFLGTYRERAERTRAILDQFLGGEGFGSSLDHGRAESAFGRRGGAAPFGGHGISRRT